MNESSNKEDINKERYEYIASQINREDSLINYRLTWTLTLNGFLFAALGFLVSKETPDMSMVNLFHWALPLTGIVVSIAGVCGVIAAHIQMYYLTEEWKKLNDNRWVRPFGKIKHSFWLGIIPCYAPSFVLIAIWFYLASQWIL